MQRVLVPYHIASRPPPIGGALHELKGETMGTTWSVRYASPIPVPFLQQGIERVLQQIIMQMSTWEPQAELARFNRAEAGSWHVLAPEFFEVLQFSQRIAEETDGALDVTAGALVNVWGFGPTRSWRDPGFEPPSQEQVEQARACCGWQRVQLDASRHSALQPGGICLDLSAVAKGFAVDQVSRHLHARGVSHHLVEIGGELRGSGVKPDASPWWVELECPDVSSQRDAGSMLLALHELSVASSGDYRRCFEHDRRRYSHSIDARSGRPIEHNLASVTVIAAECMAADAMSTALTVMGLDAGLAFAESRQVAALFTVRTPNGMEEHGTSAFMSLLE